MLVGDGVTRRMRGRHSGSGYKTHTVAAQRRILTGLPPLSNLPKQILSQVKLGYPLRWCGTWGDF